jgi:4-amino-4-deoxy-L-arabinose transferase-like glycosyltransferase
MKQLSRAMDHRGGLLALLLVSLALLVAWSFAVPMFEAPDEPDHWQYVLYVRHTGRLPLYGSGTIEANSPPLYYFLVAPFAAESDVPQKLVRIDSQGVARRPPGARWYENYNSDFSRYWPLRITRLATALISVLTVLACYYAGLEASSHRTTGLLAAGLVAFLPQFTFRGMNISNDALVTLLCAVAVYLMIRLIRRGFMWPVGLTAAVVMALAFLSKISSIFMPIPFSLAVLSEAAPWRARFRRLGVLIITVLVVAPWLVRNQLLYGDPFASRAMLTAVGNLVEIRPITSPYFVTVFPLLLFLSFVGYFGWITLWLPEWLYVLFGFLMIVCAVGLVGRWVRHSLDRRLAAILLTVPLLSLMVTLYINLTFTQPQGRYVFPALPALAVLGAMGFEGIPGWSKWATLALLVALVLLNVYILSDVVIPAYWPA